MHFYVLDKSNFLVFLISEGKKKCDEMTQLPAGEQMKASTYKYVQKLGI